jgi:hypothetical protein
MADTEQAQQEEVRRQQLIEAAQRVSEEATALLNENEGPGSAAPGAVATEAQSYVEGVLLNRDDDPIYNTALENAIRITVAATTTNVPAPPAESVGEVKIFTTDGSPTRFKINKQTLEELDLQSLVDRTGVAIEECIRFKQGSRQTLYAPLYLLLAPPAGEALVTDSPNRAFAAEATGFAMMTLTYEGAKVEMVVLLRDAANKAYGISQTNPNTCEGRCHYQRLALVPIQRR